MPVISYIYPVNADGATLMAQANVNEQFLFKCRLQKDSGGNQVLVLGHTGISGYTDFDISGLQYSASLRIGNPSASSLPINLSLSKVSGGSMGKLQGTLVARDGDFTVGDYGLAAVWVTIDPSQDPGIGDPGPPYSFVYQGVWQILIQDFGILTAP